MNYLLRLFSSGAIRKTPTRVLNVIAAEVKTSSAKRIVEAGAGYGEITACVLPALGINEQLQYYAFEINEVACAKLQHTFSNIHVVHRSAFELDAALPLAFKADVFISSIPLSFYKHGILEKFLDIVKNRLSESGIIVIVFSAPWLIFFLRRQLPGIRIKSFFTFPSYFVGVYKRQ